MFFWTVLKRLKANSHCQNTIGSFMCICDDGFYGNGANQVFQLVSVMSEKLTSYFISVSMMTNVLIEPIHVLIMHSVSILQVQAQKDYGRVFVRLMSLKKVLMNASAIPDTNSLPVEIHSILKPRYAPISMNVLKNINVVLTRNVIIQLGDK